MSQQSLADLAATVLGGDADRCQMCGPVLIDQHKNESDHLARRRYDPVAEVSRFAQQIIKSVFRVVLAVSKATYIKAQNLAQVFIRQRMNFVFGWRSRHNGLRLTNLNRYKEISNRLKNGHRKIYSMNMQSP